MVRLIIGGMFYRTITTQLAVIVEKYNKMVFVSGPRQMAKHVAVT